MSSYLAHRRKGFRGAAPPLPTHWWDLDGGTWADQGTKAAAGWDLSEGGTPSTTSSTIGSGGSRTVADLAAADYLEFDNAGTKTVAWDGDNDLISIACWAEVDSISPSFNSLVTWRGSSPDLIFQQLLVNSTTDYAQGQIWDDTPTGFVAADDEGDVPISADTWYHICTTFDGSDLKLYVNGTLVETTDASTHSGTFSTAAAPFKIGVAAWSPATSTLWHNGLMHATGIWDVALTADDVSSIYRNGDGGSYSDIWG